MHNFAKDWFLTQQRSVIALSCFERYSKPQLQLFFHLTIDLSLTGLDNRWESQGQGELERMIGSE